MDVHVYAPKAVYVGQIQSKCERRWRTVTGRCQSSESALSRALVKMTQHDHRARALWVGVGICYYDPHVSMEARRVR